MGLYLLSNVLLNNQPWWKAVIYPLLGTVIFCCTFLTKQQWQIEQQEHVAVDLASLKTVTHCCLCSYPPLLRAIQLKISSVAVQTLPKTISGPGVGQMSILIFSELVLEGAWPGEAVRTFCVICVRTTDWSVQPWPGIATCVEPWDPLSSRLTSPIEEFHNGAVTEVFCTLHHHFLQT